MEMGLNERKLDNPIWYALTESHKQFALDYGNIKFYNPEYTPFGGFIANEDFSKPLLEYSKLINDFFIIGQKPQISKPIVLHHELIVLQMIIRNKINLNIEENIIQIKEGQKNDLLQLIQLVYPEYFKIKTFYLGNYYGIYKDGKLVAVTGERMKMNEFTEVSAVITHPDYMRRGYAGQLVVYAVNEIFKQNKIPFLHVAETNIGAIKLYKKLGFETRSKISVWNLIRNY